MSIDTSVVLVSGTTSTTGGTSTAFIVKGSGDGNKKVILDDGSEFIDSEQYTFSVKDPIVNTGAPNGYTQARSTVKCVVPLTLDNGNRTTNTVSITLSMDPETSDTEKEALIELGAQLLTQASLDDFWKKQSIA